MRCAFVRILGVLSGLVSAGAVLWWAGQGGEAPRFGRLVSDCDGALIALVIQYVPEAQFAALVYHSFLPQLPAGVTVHVVCPDRAAYDQLAGQLPPLRCRLSPLLVGHGMTAWSRDRWLCLLPCAAGQPVTLLAPRGEDGAATWPARAGDQQLASDLARALAPDVAVQASPLYFDGGDFVADDSTAFVATAVIRRNVQQTVASVDELRQELSRALRRRIVLLEDAPDHHAGMFLTPVGARTVLVGDPSLARPHACPQLPGGADFSQATQARFDSVARQAAAAGYHVVRIPLVPAADGKTWLTWQNVILDQRDGRSIVYMPTYDRCDRLNTQARGVWESIGYEVRMVDCTTAYRHFGSLRCLVNVLTREASPRSGASASCRIGL